MAGFQEVKDWYRAGQEVKDRSGQDRGAGRAGQMSRTCRTQEQDVQDRGAGRERRAGKQGMRLGQQSEPGRELDTWGMSDKDAPQTREG